MMLNVTVGDIVLCDDDTIVNAANEFLAPGGGVCGAIHQAAGPGLAAACRAIGHCDTGSAVITAAFNLKCRAVIHAVGPRWVDGTHREAQLLEQCYQSIFRLVQEHHFNSVAVPAISTGIYGFPFQEAASIAVATAKRQGTLLKNVRITFVCFSKEAAEAYHQLI